MESQHVKTGIIARNSILNFFGQFIPLVIGVVTIPFVIRRLGVDNFGILSLAWMLLGYFTVFDLGMGRATTKFIAEELANGKGEQLPSIFWTSCGINLLLGVTGGIIVASLTSVLAESVFEIPQGLIETATGAFLILAIALPIVLISMAFRGVLEAAQRFDYINGVGVISSSLTFLLPLLGVLLGFGIQGIILLLTIARLGVGLTYLFLCFKVFPILKETISFDLTRVKHLMSYGGWVTVSSAVGPILVYFDRFIIGSAISIAAVAYYTAPYEMVTRLWILPASLTSTLFPAFSAIGAASRESVTILYARSVKFLFLLMGPLVVLLILFAGEILRLWLGIGFAEQSTIVFQILALGILFNSIAQISFALIQGLGRPDIPASFHLLEVVLYVPLVWLLVTNAGIVGGALAWAIRVVLDSILLFTASLKFTDVKTFLTNGIKRVLYAVGLTVVVSVALYLFEMAFIVKIVVGIAFSFLMVLISWFYLLDAGEKEFIGSSSRQFVGFLGKVR